LGVWVWWMREGVEAARVEFWARGRRTDEAIAALRVLFTEEPASFEGEFFRFGPIVTRPHPVQPGGVPIHVGGHSPAAARRAGRLGDGYHPLGLDGETLRERPAPMRTAARAADRDPDALELSLGGLLENCDEAAIEAARTAGAHRMILSTTTDDL